MAVNKCERAFEKLLQYLAFCLLRASCQKAVLYKVDLRGEVHNSQLMTLPIVRLQAVPFLQFFGLLWYLSLS